MKSFTILVSTQYMRDVGIIIPGITDDPECEAACLPAAVDPFLGSRFFKILEEAVPWAVSADQVAVISEHD